MTSRTPSANAVATPIMPANAASVSTSLEGGPRRGHRQRVAGQRAADAAHVDQVEVGAGQQGSASSADRPYAPIGMPPPMALPMVTTSGSRPQAAVAPPGPAENVCVSSLIR